MALTTQAQSDLLTKGCRTYVDALTAIEAFRREVAAICKGAYLRHATTLMEAMGLGPDACVRYENTYVEDRLAELGVRRPAQLGQLFYIYLQWSQEEDGAPAVKAFVCLDVSKKVREEILGEIQRKNLDCRLQQDIGVGYNLCLDAPVNATEPASVGQILDNLLSDWIDYCKSIGGLKLKERQAR